MMHAYLCNHYVCFVIGVKLLTGESEGLRKRVPLILSYVIILSLFIHIKDLS